MVAGPLEAAVPSEPRVIVCCPSRSLRKPGGSSRRTENERSRSQMEHTPQTHQGLEPDTQTGQGLSVPRYFTTPGEHPFDAIEWELRDARIAHGDKVSFEQREVEFPRT